MFDFDVAKVRLELNAPDLLVSANKNALTFARLIFKSAKQTEENKNSETQKLIRQLMCAFSQYNVCNDIMYRMIGLCILHNDFDNFYYTLFLRKIKKEISEHKEIVPFAIVAKNVKDYYIAEQWEFPPASFDARSKFDRVKQQVAEIKKEIAFYEEKIQESTKELDINAKEHYQQKKNEAILKFEKIKI